MTKLPQVSGRECAKALQRAGYVVRRQTGSHIVLTRPDPYGFVSVPNHRALKAGTLRAIISQAGLTVAEFLDLL